MSEEHKEPNMAQVNIGELLSAKRAAKGLSIAQVVTDTKLSYRVVEQLEDSQFSEIGTPVYVRGYLSGYAKYLGLDAANIIQLYDTQYPAETVNIKPAIGSGMSRKKVKRHSKTLSMIAALAVFAGLAYGYSQIEPFVLPAANISAASNNTAMNSAGIDSAIDAAKSANHLAEDALNGLPVTGTQALSDEELEDLSEGLDDAGLSDARENESATDLSEKKDKEDGLKGTDETKDNLQKATLVVQFNNEIWLKVSDKNGKQLVQGIYDKKKQLSVTGEGPFLLKTARPEAVASIQLNDTPLVLEKYKVGRRKYQLK